MVSTAPTSSQGATERECREGLGTPVLSTHADPDFLLVASAMVPVHLQESKQLILHYRKCNQILQAQLRTLRTLVKQGMICGYQEEKGPCKVSSWLHGSLRIEDVPSKSPHSRVPGPGSSATASPHSWGESLIAPLSWPGLFLQKRVALAAWGHCQGGGKSGSG